MLDDDSERRPQAVIPAEPADPATVQRLDAIVGEPARPDHVFRWLTAPGGDDSDWLPVDAYYPAARMIVELPRAGAEDSDRERRAALAADNGLRHITLTAADLELGDDELRARLVGRPRHDEPLLPRAVASGEGAWRPPPEPRAQDPSGAAPSFAERAPRLAAVSSRVETALADQRPEVSGLELGIALTAIGVVELFAAVSVLLASTGASLLALGLTLDAAARIVAVLSALAGHERRRAWTCMLVGSPAVVLFVLSRPRGAPIAATDTIAGALAIAAILSLLGALLASV